MADLIRVELGEGRYSWGSANPTISGTERPRSIDALKATAAGNINPLIDFACN